MAAFLSYSPDLNSDAVLQWAADRGAPSPLPPVAPIAPTGFTLHANARPAPPTELPFVTGMTEHYGVFEGTNQISNLEFWIPVTQQIRMTIFVYLATRDTLPPATVQALRAAFDAFVVGGPVSVLQAIVTAMGNTVNDDDFEFLYSHELERIDPRVEHREQADAILAMYNGAGNGFFPGSDRRIGEEFQERGLRYVLVRTEYGTRPPPPPDPVHVRELPAGIPPSQIIDQMAAADIALVDPADGCAFVVARRVERRIAVLVEFPEWKLEWENVTVRVGRCATIVLTLPVLYQRVGRLELWAYCPVPHPVTKIVENMIVACLEKAALTSAVIGIVFQNLALALAAFKPIFVECIDYHLNNVVTCLLPNLALLQSSDQWRRV